MIDRERPSVRGESESQHPYSPASHTVSSLTKPGSSNKPEMHLSSDSDDEKTEIDRDEETRRAGREI